MTRHAKSATLIGQTIAGKYLLESIIGEGGFGAVFRALNLVDRKRYAVKLIYAPDSLAERSQNLQYFQREVGTLSRVRHDAIVSVYEGGMTIDGNFYITMELVEGVLLSKILRQGGGLSLNRMIHIFSQLCSAVDAIHQQSIIHRDLKPENIVISGNIGAEKVKLLDFGLAKLIRGENEEKWLRTLTGQGQIHGTVYYMSPEQCQDQKLDERTDIYSLGILAYEMLTGKPPFCAPTPFRVMMMHLDATPPSLQSQCPYINSSIEAIILKALEKEACKRYEKASHLAEQLYQAVSQNINLSANEIAKSDENSSVSSSLVAEQITNKETETSNRPATQARAKAITKRIEGVTNGFKKK